MSAKTMGKVWEYRLAPAKQTVLLALADHADQQDGSIKPGVPLIAWKTGYSERQVQRIMKELESEGVLFPVHTSANRPTEYRIDFAKATPKPAFVPRKKSTEGDKMSPRQGDTDVTPDTAEMSPRQDVTPTSRGNEDQARGDMASANLTSIHQKEEPSLKDKSIAPAGALTSEIIPESISPNLSAASSAPPSDDTPAPAVVPAAADDPYADWVPMDQLPEEPPITAYPCTKADINALIAAWWDWVPQRPTKRGKEVPSRAHFSNPANREFAQTLTERGASPADLIGLLADIRVNPRSPWAYLREREMTFCYVGEILLDWIEADRAENWYTADCPRITPRKPGYTLRLGEILDGVDMVATFADDPNVIIDLPKPWLSPTPAEEDLNADEWESSYQADDATYLAELAEMGMPL